MVQPLSTLLGLHFISLKDKVNALKIINDIGFQELQDHFDSLKQKIKNKVNKLHEKAKSEYNLYSLNLLGLSYDKDFPSEFHISHQKVAKLIGEETEMYTHRENIPIFFREMILVYSVIVFEEFVSKILESLFLKKPETLKTEKTIAYEELVQFKDLNEVINFVSKKEVDSIISMGIDEIGNYLKNRFKLDLTKETDWSQFREKFFRRNIIVHNYGYPNEIYNSKTRNKSNKNERLEINKQYLEDTFAIIEKYSKKIFLDIYNKHT